MLRLYNSLTRKKELFRPLRNENVLLYVCGITPYDTTHLGHVFTYISFDALSRYLQYKGYKVTYVQNVTDIDDDILKRAKQEKKGWRELGNFWTDRFLADMKVLNVQMPSHYVRATDSIEKIIEITSKLLRDGFAYKNEGNVYFERKKFVEYGKLSKYSEKQMLFLSKERGGDIKDKRKKDPLDFVLWQKSKRGEPFWESPWGKGRPGWHVECSAMIHHYLGEQIDIHGGGRDLIYPHHESEIAQSESFTRESPFVKYWMHTAMLMYEGEKMSKSLGNLVMATELLKTYSPNAIRWVLLSHHYRTSWEFFECELDEAERHINAIKNLLESKEVLGNVDEEAVKEFEEYMDDDLHTPHALFLIQQLTKKSDQATVRELLGILGFLGN